MSVQDQQDSALPFLVKTDRFIYFLILRFGIAINVEAIERGMVHLHFQMLNLSFLDVSNEVIAFLP